MAILLGYFAYSKGWISIRYTANNYDKLGSYVPKTFISKDKEGKLNYISYYPEGGIESDMPVVIFIKAGGKLTIYDYSGIMKFMASKGYYVMGVDANTYVSSHLMMYLEKALNEIIKEHHLNISRFAVMGNSLGGGQVFYVTNALRNKGYGKRGSLAVSVDGWFAFNMDEENLTKLEGKVSFIQMNGLKGTGTDPRINLKIWNLLGDAEKSFYTLPSQNHNYIAGDLANILPRKDLLFMIGALCSDAFNGSNKGSLQIPQINRASYEDIFNELESQSSYKSGDCKGIQYNGVDIIKNNNIDYCTLK